MSDGLKVVRVEIHPRIPRSTKRVLVNGTAVESDSPSHRVPSEKLRRSDSDSKVNIFANVIKAKETVTSSSHANTEKTAVRSGKTTIKRKHPYSADVAEIDENGDNLEVLESEESYDSNRNVDDPNEISDGEYIEGNEEQSVRDDEEEDLIHAVANESVTSESVNDESDEDEGDSDDDSDRTIMVFDLEDVRNLYDRKDQKATVPHQIALCGVKFYPMGN
ncbi:hypothetical protein KIN20_029559 [Parelaphostrongylus tenuis]|uniref:Uncharacterized protein n=1 Tax=Parelaphostrongylus tenuis TaxID=148309 RepID=A0AAD5WFL2_PARTN|nr:hypothetical protein KIN20_029556 [Parelaphostrongylus tenuis]KAJ1368434.1 hypothetical protein KIN20_029559 [Parelaphostrongylus tenuis]